MGAGVHAALFVACLLWGASFVATKVALRDVPPLTVVTIRLLVSASCFLPYLWMRRERLLRGGWPAFRKILGLSFLGTGLHYGVQTLGLQFTSASNASLYAATGPIAIAIVGALVLRERVGLRKGLGILLACTGATLVSGPEILRDFDLSAHLIGDTLVFASIVLWALFTVFGKRVTEEMGAMLLLGAASVVGALWMLPVGVGEMLVLGFSPLEIPRDAWLGILFLGVGCGFLATLLYFVALERTESQKVGVYLYGIPPMTWLFASLILDEPLGWRLLAGTLLVVLGVIVTERS
jgi:drug/metabolite transporter (DMT)-like permease